MSAVAFDTLKFARALRERAHLSAEQAEGLSEVFAEAVQGGLPTQGDLQGLEGSVKAEFMAVRAEIAAFQAETRSEFAAVRSELVASQVETRNEFAAVRQEMKSEFAAVRSEMKTEFAAVRSEMKTEFAAVRSDMKLLEHRMTIKLGAMLVALVGILLAAIRYMPAR
ncbi:coiled-coil domain-containing protein [Methylobacterium sp. EM32]|uniref:coiled-coil domain-containing protein n=1 Tax=Methylobacterium sp. EM32 TaxID=3163481 RepID=UPI0033AD6E8B